MFLPGRARGGRATHHAGPGRGEVCEREDRHLGAFAPDITDFQHELVGQFVLHSKIPLLRVAEAVFTVPGPEQARSCAGRDGGVRRIHRIDRRQSRAPIEHADTLAEGIGPLASMGLQLPEVVVNVKDAVAGPHGGLGGERESKADTGREIVEIRVTDRPDGVGRLACDRVVASPDEFAVMPVKLRQAVKFIPGQLRVLIPQPQIDHQSRRHPIVVLNVEVVHVPTAVKARVAQSSTTPVRVPQQEGSQRGPRADGILGIRGRKSREAEIGLIEVVVHAPDLVDAEARAERVFSAHVGELENILQVVGRR